MRRGLTLVELTVVVAVIAVLIGLGLPAYSVFAARSKGWKTRSTVQAVAAVIAGAQERSVVLADGRRRERFDADGPEAAVLPEAERRARRWLIDGDPARDPDWAGGSALADALGAVGYRGFADAGARLPARALDPAGRPLDGWQRPLRLRYAQDRFPPGGVGVWSDGRDGIPAEGDGDDITSWSVR